MDFLKIRNKAKARSAGAARPAEASAREPAPPPPEALAPPPPAAEALAPSPPPVPPATEADALEGALAARLQGFSPLPPSEGPDVRFTTWRPGAGSPPALPPQPGHVPDPLRPSDFAVVRPPQTSAREPFQPRPSPRAPRAPDPLPAVLAAPPADPLDAFFYRDDEDAPPMPGFETATPAEALGPAAADAREEYITFLLGAEEYAVAIERVREVLRCPPVTEVPRAPAHVRGVVSVRGEVVAVVEPRRRLGLPDGGREPEGSRLLVVDVGDGPVGLLVDAVSSVVRLRPGSIEPCPQGIGGASQEYLAGIGRERDRLFTVLDLGALLRRTATVRRRAEGNPRAG